MNDILQILATHSSASGYENSVIEMYRDMISNYVDKIYVDEIGNLIAHKYGNPNHSTVLVTAHADEVGFVVKRIDKNGLVYVSTIGGVNINSLPGKTIVFYNENGFTYGTFGLKPIHMSIHEDMKPSHIYELWVDIGCNNYDSAIKHVSIGDPATFLPFYKLTDDKYILSKSLDNRVSMYVIYKFLQQVADIQMNIKIALTVQEEIGRRGAMSLANNLDVSKCIILDVSHATDYPGVNINQYGDIRLGEGVVIPRGANIDKSIFSQLLNVANSLGIKYQKDVIPNDSRTDAAIFQNIGINRKVGLISIPIRYMHSPIEVANMEDVESAINLLTDYVKQINMI